MLTLRDLYYGTSGERLQMTEVQQDSPATVQFKGQGQASEVLWEEPRTAVMCPPTVRRRAGA